MSVQEIKEKLAGLARKEQDEVIAYLLHLRHEADAIYKKNIARRLDDRDRSHWLSPGEFERALDDKKARQMQAYGVFLHLDLLDVVPTRGDQRRLIMNFVRSLAENPRTPGDFTDKDESLRTRQVKIVGRYAITYWLDEAARAVMVVAVDPADG